MCCCDTMHTEEWVNMRFPSGWVLIASFFVADSPESLERLSYQLAAEEVLGAVTLGTLLGMGSFGRVYKGESVALVWQ